MSRILLIDDDERLHGPLAEYFGRFDLELVAAGRPGDGLKRLARGDIDLLILDVMLPEQDGFEVCRSVRRDSDIPIIMLTARGEVTDRVVGFELGADDYLPKPFEPRELVARVQSILKRARGGPREAHILRFPELEVDLELRQARVAGHEVPLTGMEYQLLALLAASPGRSFSRDEILNRLKGVDADLYTRSVDILVSRLRQKLRPTEYIKTVWGSGYSFVAPRQ